MCLLSSGFFPGHYIVWTISNLTAISCGARLTVEELGSPISEAPGPNSSYLGRCPSCRRVERMANVGIPETQLHNWSGAGAVRLAHRSVPESQLQTWANPGAMA